ncbi:MAG: hypothetical protein AAF585_19240, partial [Verrucomicrobiota bacterium]
MAANPHLIGAYVESQGSTRVYSLILMIGGLIGGLAWLAFFEPSVPIIAGIALVIMIVVGAMLNSAPRTLAIFSNGIHLEPQKISVLWEDIDRIEVCSRRLWFVLKTKQGVELSDIYMPIDWLPEAERRALVELTTAQLEMFRKFGQHLLPENANPTLRTEHLVLRGFENGDRQSFTNIETHEDVAAAQLFEPFPSDFVENVAFNLSRNPA